MESRNQHNPIDSKLEKPKNGTYGALSMGHLLKPKIVKKKLVVLGAPSLPAHGAIPITPIGKLLHKKNCFLESLAVLKLSMKSYKSKIECTIAAKSVGLQFLVNTTKGIANLPITIQYSVPYF